MTGVDTYGRMLATKALKRTRIQTFNTVAQLLASTGYEGQLASAKDTDHLYLFEGGGWVDTGVNAPDVVARQVAAQAQITADAAQIAANQAVAAIPYTNTWCLEDGSAVLPLTTSYVKVGITGATKRPVSSYAFTLANSEITCLRKGIVKMTRTVNLSGRLDENIVIYHTIRKNGTSDLFENIFEGSRQNFHSEFYIEVNVGDVLSIWAKANKSDSATAQNRRITVEYV